MSEKNKGKVATSAITKIGVLGAISFVLMYFEFPLPFIAPSFYKLDVSESVILIGGYAMGPWAAIVLELIKNSLNLLIEGTQTGGVGELANFLIGSSLTVPAAFVYKYRKSRSGAVVSLAVGVVSLVFIGALVNYFVMIPAYAKVFFGGDVEGIVALGGAIFPFVDDLLSFVLVCTSPFNLIKGAVCSLICYLLYKRVSPILHI